MLIGGGSETGPARDCGGHLWLLFLYGRCRISPTGINRENTSERFIPGAGSPS